MPDVPVPSSPPTSARAYGCPSCGASVAEGSRRCGYCRVPIATLRCATCFHMNVQEAFHCSACGRDLGLEPLGEAATLVCPHDHEALQAFAHDAGKLFDCGACGGQFVEHAMLRAMLQHHEIKNAEPMSIRKPTAIVGAVRYIPCPLCQALMNRKNFGITSGVIVDVCKTHGTWFDAGELPRVLAFAAHGGLEQEKKRLAEEAEQRKHASVAAAAAAQTSHEMSAGHHGSLRDFGAHFAQSLIDLLRS